MRRFIDSNSCLTLTHEIYYVLPEREVGPCENRYLESDHRAQTCGKFHLAESSTSIQP